MKKEKGGLSSSVSLVKSMPWLLLGRNSGAVMNSQLSQEDLVQLLIDFC